MFLSTKSINKCTQNSVINYGFYLVGFLRYLVKNNVIRDLVKIIKNFFLVNKQKTLAFD